MAKWDADSLNSLKKRGLKVSGFQKQEGKILPAAIQRFSDQLKLMGVDHEFEARFDDVRKYRFDIYIPEYKIAIEYEGINSEKSRHTTIGGYTEDCNKYNLAATKGIAVLRYTMINHENFKNDIKKLIDERRTFCVEN